MHSFNLADHLNTAPELVDRVYNRPTLETLETKRIQGAVDPRALGVCGDDVYSFFEYFFKIQLLRIVH